MSGETETSTELRTDRTVTIDFVAIILVGLVLSLLLSLNVIVTVWEHEHRSDEHDLIQRHLTLVDRDVVRLERAERAETHP